MAIKMKTKSLFKIHTRIPQKSDQQVASEDSEKYVMILNESEWHQFRIYFLINLPNPQNILNLFLYSTTR